jgi:hypothetical protein
MSERLTDEQLREWLEQKNPPSWNSSTTTRAMATELLAIRQAMDWFANPRNWHEEQLSEGYHFTAEWKIGFDPRAIARRALGRE